MQSLIYFLLFAYRFSNLVLLVLISKVFSYSESLVYFESIDTEFLQRSKLRFLHSLVVSLISFSIFLKKIENIILDGKEIKKFDIE